MVGPLLGVRMSRPGEGEHAVIKTEASISMATAAAQLAVLIPVGRTCEHIELLPRNPPVALAHHPP